MKKKTKRRISKIVFIICCFATIFSLFAVNVLAYQQTNHQLYSYNWDGINSYAFCPIDSFYYQKVNFDGSYTNYSVNVPNTITFEGKSNWNTNGMPLIESKVETFGQHGRMMWRDSSTHFGRTVIDEMSYKSNLLYPFFDEDDIYFTEGNLVDKGTCVDIMTYGIFNNVADSYPEDLSVEVLFSPFVTSISLCPYLLSYNLQTGTNTDYSLDVYYEFTYQGNDGLFRSVRGECPVGWNSSANSSFGSDGSGYIATKTYGGNILESILIYEEEEMQREYLDRESHNLIRFDTLVVKGHGNTDTPLYSFSLSQSMLRPYSKDIIRMVQNGENISQYQNPYYMSINNIGLRIWDLSFSSSLLDDPPALDVGPLGTSIGNAVEGVFSAEIFPGVSLWVLLLIPFSFGLIFAILKYFAGG